MLARERRATRRSVLCFVDDSFPLRARRERDKLARTRCRRAHAAARYIYLYMYIFIQCTVLYCTVLYTEMSCNSYCKRRTVARLALRHGGRAVRPRREKAIGRGQREGEPVAVVPHLRVTTTNEGGGWVRRAPPRVRTSVGRLPSPAPRTRLPPFRSPSRRRSVRLRTAVPFAFAPRRASSGGRERRERGAIAHTHEKRT